MKETLKHLMCFPPLDSRNGADVDNLILYIHYLMFALFAGWIVYFFYAIWRFRKSRNPKADYHGVRNHASNYIELIVAGVEAFLLVVVAIPLWSKAVDKFPDADKSTVVYVQAQQFAWNFLYPGQDGQFGRMDMNLVSTTNVFGLDTMDISTKDDFQSLNEIHVPVNKPVILYVSSRDVIHSLKIISMRVCQDAIPGLRVPCWFVPTTVGRYQINCAQLCGSGHAYMTGGFLVVDTPEDYQKWIQAKYAAAAPPANYE
ncbi:MAG TPA: cytochrome c oxidase subunit II [Verrucomicrobiae bacterium]|nr:cytochrome c oxidase subunit II [Verrucomicrobiae bacterium]